MMCAHSLQLSIQILQFLNPAMVGEKQAFHLTTTAVTTFTATSPTILLVRCQWQRPIWMRTIRLQQPHCTKFATRTTIVDLRPESTTSPFIFIATTLETME